MAAVVLAAVTAQVPDDAPDEDPDATRDWDAEFWSVVARLEPRTGTVTRCPAGDGTSPVPSRLRVLRERRRPVVRRPTGRERSPPTRGGARCSARLSAPSTRRRRGGRSP
ncbi:hypothetical protein GCM10027519_40650 [Kineococcus endophyticus]